VAPYLVIPCQTIFERLKMKVLIACEFSGTVRDAFAKLGHDAWSCDLEATDVPGNHYQGDMFDIIHDGWDLMIAHPPCTHLAVSGARHFAKKREDGRQQQGIDFFIKVVSTNIPMVAVENPIGIMSSIYRKPDQIVQPYEYGHKTTKATCLWLKGLPLLKPTNIVEKGEFVVFPSGKRMSKWYADSAKHSPKERERIRNKTFQGIADAMAQQWGEK
jgi:site-specific DNA-cytosine methylase